MVRRIRAVIAKRRNRRAAAKQIRWGLDYISRTYGERPG
jgi:hypothetical protein